MSEIIDVIDNIVKLGREHEWFIDFLQGLDEYDYISTKGNVIVIDTTCIKAFVDENRVLSNDELKDYLREMIDVNIPEAYDFQIKIEVKNENNYL